MTRYWLFAMLFLALTSCNKEVEEELPWECLPCGHYYGSFSGHLQLSLSGTDTNFVNSPTVLEITEGLNESIDIKFDVSNLLGTSQGTNVLNLRQIYWKDSTITGTSSLYNGIGNVTIDANNIYNYQAIEGTITTSGDATGEFSFVLIR